MTYRERLRNRRRGAGLLGGFLLIAGLACGPAAEERQAAKPSPTAVAEWAWLQKTKQTLDGQRAQLAAGTAAADLARRSEALAALFNRRLAEFINADPPVQGEPLTKVQQAAIRMKSDEDIRLAQQFIAQGGDYQRAIDIYQEALVVDPQNPRLREELARARARRYMTRQTFAAVKAGMGQDEVRALLGQPNLHNVRAYPRHAVIGWFYPKDESGAAAAVWFHDDGGRYTVYLLDFAALEPRSPTRPAEPPSTPPRSAT
jgi:tetratricopeptide (TPR) repeat protein